MKSKSEKWQLKRIGTMSFINDECDNVKQSDKSFFANIIKNIYLEVIADFKELEGTIEKMKAIACEKIEPINGVTSVDYPNDNETELITEREDVFSGCFSEITKTKCCGIAPITIANVMVRFFSNLFTSECPKCKVGRVRYIGDDWTGHTWINVYKCKKCKTEFV